MTCFVPDAKLQSGDTKNQLGLAKSEHLVTYLRNLCIKLRGELIFLQYDCIFIFWRQVTNIHSVKFQNFR